MEDWLPGYSISELDDAQARYGLTFPPDLLSLLSERRPARGYDWRHDSAEIRRAMRHPLEGLLFDLEHNALWWPEWGNRPNTKDERASVLTSVVAAAPKLIPIMSHRYIPETPSEAGNPIFSVMHSDTIYYGANLEDYFQREFDAFQFVNAPLASSVRHIPFWSDLVNRNPLISPAP